jgi:hypothetical protein
MRLVTGFRTTIEALTTTLKFQPFLTSENKVLAVLRGECSGAEHARAALKQYCFLPSVIAEFLTIGMERLSDWPDAAEELRRNRGEELGSRTNGTSHYQILERRLDVELGVKLSGSTPCPSTAKFLRDVRQALWRQSKPTVAGILYALEASAVDELLVVAEILNESARLFQLQPLMNVELMRNCKDRSVLTSANPASKNLTLADFISLHLFDFEIGHERGLANAFEPYVAESQELVEFQVGFGKLLVDMDEWWTGMACELGQLVSEPKGPQRTGITDFAGVAL